MLRSASVSPVLSVSDLDRARRFYEDELGLREVDAGPNEVTLACGPGCALTLHAVPDAHPSEHTCATFEVEDLLAEMHDLRQHGVRFEDYDLPDLKTQDGVATIEGERCAWFKDPEGNVLCLHEAPGGRLDS